MKRRILLKHFLQHGCKLAREGKKHSVYWNPSNGKISTMPRHTEISDRLALKICRDLGIPAP